MSSSVRLQYGVYSGIRHHYLPRPRSAGWLAVLLVVSVGLLLLFEHPGKHAMALSDVTTDNLVTTAAHAAVTSAPPIQTTPPVDPSAAPTVAVQAAMQANQAQSWSVAAYDLNRDRWLVQLNANQSMFSASLYKLYAAYGTAQRVPFSAWPTTTVANTTLSDCVDRMLRLSDNTCGDAVASMIGWGTIDRYDRALGFTQTKLNLPSGPQTSASDTANYLIDLYKGTLFDATTTASILNSLQHQVYRSGIPAGCPGCTIYNKTGSDLGIAHDAAIVESGDLRYVVVIMSQGGSSQKIAHLEQALQTALIAGQ